jgi:hypothetical protein
MSVAMVAFPHPQSLSRRRAGGNVVMHVACGRAHE